MTLGKGFWVVPGAGTPGYPDHWIALEKLTSPWSLFLAAKTLETVCVPRGIGFGPEDLFRRN